MPKGKQNAKVTTPAPIVANKAYKYRDSVTVHGLTVTKAECSEMARDYVWAYGVTQTLQDSVAGVVKAMGEANDRNKGTDDFLAPADLEEAIDAALLEIVTDRWARIQNGMIAVRVAGPRLYGIAKLTRDVTDEYIRAEAVRAKKTMPSGERLEKYREIMQASKFGAEIKAEAERRLAAQNALEKAEESAINFDASDEALGIAKAEPQAA